MTSHIAPAAPCWKVGRSPRRIVPIEELFWPKVTKGWPDGCWLWSASVNPDTGYGAVRGKYAHRVSWQIHNGPIPYGLWVLHKCDQPSCVNPKHLFLGTAADNNRDMASKGRAGKKLSPSDILDIRRRLAAGESQSSIGRLYGTSHRNIGYIQSGGIWSWVTDKS